MKSDLLKKLNGMKARCVALNGLDAAGTNLSGLDKVFEAALTPPADNKPKTIAFNGEETPLWDVLEMARDGNRKAQKAILALRVEQYDLFVRASSNFAMFYEQQSLKPDEQLAVDHSYRNPCRVRYTGEDGGGRTVKAVKARKMVHVNMKLIKTDRLGYVIKDLEQGPNIAGPSQATVDLSFELGNKVDVECFNFMVGGTINGISYGAGVFGNFRKTGEPLDRTWVQHPRIYAGNLPAKNDYVASDLDDVGAAALDAQEVYLRDRGLFRPAVLRKIIKHCGSFANVLGGRPLSPTGVILMPSSEIDQLLRGINPFGAKATDIAEGVLQNYVQLDYGRRWTLVPDVTLPPGTCYPVLDRPIGKLLTKPDWDEEFTDTDRENNWEERSMQKAISLASFEPQRVGALRITYSGNTVQVVTSNE